MSNLNRITIESEICGGRPTIKGTRVRVSDILGMLAGGTTRETVLADFPYLKSEDIAAALEYASAHTSHRILKAARVRWLIDEQLSPRLVAWLEAKGHEAVHVRDVLGAGTVDATIWDHAVKENVILLSKDEDFPSRHAVSKIKPRIVWIRFENCAYAEFVKKFETVFPALISDLEAGAELVEVTDPDR